MNCQILFPGKNKTNTSTCCLLKFLPRVLSVNKSVSSYIDLFSIFLRRFVFCWQLDDQNMLHLSSTLKFEVNNHNWWNGFWLEKFHRFMHCLAYQCLTQTYINLNRDIWLSEKDVSNICVYQNICLIFYLNILKVFCPFLNRVCMKWQIIAISNIFIQIVSKGRKDLNKIVKNRNWDRWKQSHWPCLLFGKVADASRCETILCACQKKNRYVICE